MMTLAELLAVYLDEAPAELRALDPASKVRVVEAMGFTPKRSAHDRDCAAHLTSGTYMCTCAGEPTEWGGPPDVEKHRGEDWGSRVAARRAREMRESA